MGVVRSWRWLVARVMRVLLRWSRLCSWNRRGQLLLKPRPLFSYWLLVLKSLYYNSLCDSDAVLDAVFEPIYWVVDTFTRWFGVVFVCLVCVLTTSVVVIVYVCVLPLFLESYSPLRVLFHLLYGNWNLLMITFHYYKATHTHPGSPAQDRREGSSVTMCKKCIAPKPARTHHCSVCNRCIMKMDHHCPWLNNCVGHFNHRYFFSFCLFMTLGCVYCSVSSLDLFLDAYNAIEATYQSPAPDFTFAEKLSHKSLVYLWVLTSSVAVALGGLTLWHWLLIMRGETSVERHIHKKETRRLQEQGKVFRNPYHFGRLNNLKILFGVEKRSHWLTRVLLPSSHPPYGDGVTWDTHSPPHTHTHHRTDPMAI
ncbi:palmitoyltransferase ZDHHC16B [Engraulis encrasicolus]|uniref:palmitoyltransferase ZDHHC16B n=1 Tax=Engraulis encrasicolus TaxID=184585 RepID=UPI002FD2325D